MDYYWEQDVSVMSGVMNQVTYRSFSVEQIKENVLVTCVDLNSGEKVYSWIVRI
jgi:hypothetical protein